MGLPIKNKEGKYFSIRNGFILCAFLFTYFNLGLDNVLSDFISKQFKPKYIRAESINNMPVTRESLLYSYWGSYDDQATKFFYDKLVDKKEIEGKSIDEIIKYVKSPIEARAMVIYYGSKNGILENFRLYSFRDIVEKHKKIDCSEAAVIAAATLSDKGYPPVILDMKNDNVEHMAFVWKEGGKFGYIDINGMSEPRFNTIDNLVEKIEGELGYKFPKRSLIDLEKEGKDWINVMPIK